MREMTTSLPLFLSFTFVHVAQMSFALGRHILPHARVESREKNERRLANIQALLLYLGAILARTLMCPALALIVHILDTVQLLSKLWWCEWLKGACYIPALALAWFWQTLDYQRHLSLKIGENSSTPINTSFVECWRGIS